VIGRIPTSKDVVVNTSGDVSRETSVAAINGAGCTAITVVEAIVMRHFTHPD
jgi:hypothetical protein